MNTPIANYLNTVDATTGTTLDEFAAAVIAMRRTGSTFMATLALERAELDDAHALEATARLTKAPEDRQRGPQLYDILESAAQRTTFLQDRWAQALALLTQLRTGADDLRDDQRRIREFLAAPAVVTSVVTASAVPGASTPTAGVPQS